MYYICQATTMIPAVNLTTPDPTALIKFRMHFDHFRSCKRGFLARLCRSRDQRASNWSVASPLP
jgi:hypothetical protein